MRALYAIAKRDVESFGFLQQSTINRFLAAGIDPSRIEQELIHG